MKNTEELLPFLKNSQSNYKASNQFNKKQKQKKNNAVFMHAVHN